MGFDWMLIGMIAMMIPPSILLFFVACFLLGVIVAGAIAFCIAGYYLVYKWLLAFTPKD